MFTSSYGKSLQPKLPQSWEANWQQNCTHFTK